MDALLARAPGQPATPKAGRMNEPVSIHAFDLIVAILKELERQQPGATITQHQYDVTTRACNAIADAMRDRIGIVTLQTGARHD